jgi:hypothetical protein
MENVVESDGDRFADVVENVKLNESLTHVLRYVKDLVKNDETDFEAQTCLEVLESMQSNTADTIGNAIA